MSRLIPYAGSSRRSVSETVVEAVPAAAGTQVTPSGQDRLESIAKYVPAEVLAFYLPAVNAVEMMTKEAKEWQTVLHRGIFAIAWLGVAAYFKWIAKGDARAVRQIIVSTIAFPIWVYATNRNVGVFANFYNDGASLLVLLTFSFICGFLVPQPPRN
jgi:hypothetical protein